jgi:hypothetical protein
MPIGIPQHDSPLFSLANHDYSLAGETVAG